MNWFSAFCYVGTFGNLSYCFWRMASPYATTYGWEKELETADRLLDSLERPQTPDVIEFSTGNFGTGYWTYRILDAGQFRAIARFKRGTDKLIDFRVYNRHDVAFTKLPNGNWKVDIVAKRNTFTDVEIRPGSSISENTNRIEDATLKHT